MSLAPQLVAREPPLRPAGVVATGAAAAALAAATVRRLVAGADLRACASDRWLLVLGSEHDLPWADGCTYVGRDGPLLVATTVRVQPAAELVARAALGGAAPAGAVLVLLDGEILHAPAPRRAADPGALAAHAFAAP